MKMVQNEVTETIHKHEIGTDGLQTKCGISYHVDAAQLQLLSDRHVADDDTDNKCGRCFEGCGGY